MVDESVWRVEDIDEHALVFEDLVGDVGFGGIGMEDVVYHFSDHAPRGAIFLVGVTRRSKAGNNRVDRRQSCGRSPHWDSLPTYHENHSHSAADQVLCYIRVLPVRVDVAALI